MATVVDQALDTNLTETSVTDVTTTCCNCGGTGTVSETREPYADELTDDQIRFLVEADLQEIKLTNPMMGEESGGQSQQQHPRPQPRSQSQPQSSLADVGPDNYQPSGPLPPDANI